MRIVLACVGACVLIACGAEPGASGTIYIDPPMNDDIGCIGVAGFEVTVSPLDRAAHTEQLVRQTTISGAKDCALPRRLLIRDLTIDSPVEVTVDGYDSSGKPRVTGRATIRSLRDDPVPLQLKPAASPLPALFIFDRSLYLEGVPMKDVNALEIIRQKMGMETVLNVSRMSAGPYFDPEPGAHGIENLDRTGTDAGQTVTLRFTAQNQIINSPRIELSWTGTHYVPKAP